MQGSLQFFLEHSLDGGQVGVYLWGEGGGGSHFAGGHFENIDWFWEAIYESMGGHFSRFHESRSNQLKEHELKLYHS